MGVFFLAAVAREIYRIVSLVSEVTGGISFRVFGSAGVPPSLHESDIPCVMLEPVCTFLRFFEMAWYTALLTWEPWPMYMRSPSLLVRGAATCIRPGLPGARGRFLVYCSPFDRAVMDHSCRGTRWLLVVRQHRRISPIFFSSSVLWVSPNKGERGEYIPLNHPCSAG